MKEKYIEERFSRYFVFGTKNGLIDVASTENDTIATCTPEEADYLIKDRDKAIDMLMVLAQELDKVAPVVFKEVWYK